MSDKEFNIEQIHKMKKLFIITYAALLMCACGPINEPVITSGDLKISINRSMDFKIESTAAGTNDIFSNFASTDGVIADEATISTWKLKDWKEQKGAEGKTFTLHGSWEKDGYNIEKVLTIQVLDKFKDMVFINSSYVSHSNKILTVRALESNKVNIATKDSLWSFQPTCPGCENWTVLVEGGFYHKNVLDTSDCAVIPMVTLWRNDANLSIGLVEPETKPIAIPVKRIRYRDHATMYLLQEFEEPVLLQKGDTLNTWKQFISVGKGDFTGPFKQYARYMKEHAGREFSIVQDTPDSL